VAQTTKESLFDFR